jgi:hypothetical protein
MKQTETTLSPSVHREVSPICRVMHILTLLVASVGAGWLSPPLAHSQNVLEWNRAWCNAVGNCPSFYRLQISGAQGSNSARIISGTNYSPLRAAQFSTSFGFGSAPQHVFGTMAQGPRLQFHLGSPLMANRPGPSITNDVWKGGAGNWSNGSMWSAGVPNSSDNVLIDNGNPKHSPVTLDVNGSANNLKIDSDDSLSFDTGTTLSISGNTIANAGQIVITGGNNANTVLGLGASTVLSGTGTVTLAYSGSGNGAAYILQNVGGVTLTNEETIQGTGIIGNGGLALVNSSGGIIDANVSNAGLTLNGGGDVTNAGLLEATNGGVLAIATGVNNATGNITANGGTVEISATVQSGTLNSLNGGTLETAGGATLDGSTNGALTLSKGSTYTGNPGTTTNVLGTITNHGNFHMIGGSNANTVFGLSGSTTLNGGGTVTLAYNGNGNGAAYILQNAGGLTLTNVDNTIQGTGIIGDGGLALVNQSKGKIDANVSGAGLTLNGGGGVTNTGLLEATKNGILGINTTIDNAGGNITANGGTVEVYGATIQGGTLTNTGGGTLETPGGQGATLDGSTAAGAVTLNGTYSSLEGSTTDLLGTVNNKGTLFILGGSNANTVLGLSGNTTLQSGGTVTLAYDGSGNGAAYILQNAGGLTLTNVNNMIQGEGIIGNGGLTFVNEAGGTVLANSAGSPVAGTLTLNGGGGVTNLGLMEATNKSTLAINTTVNNAGGNITANGTGVVAISGTIQGGTLNTKNGGTMETAGSATLDGSTHGALTLSTGSVYTANPGNTINVLGTITDQGNIQVIGGSNANTVLGLSSNTTFNGAGTVTLAYNGSGNGAAYILQNAGGLTLTNQDTIQGAGVIGNGGLTLLNAAGGKLFANVSGQTLLINGGGSITNKGTMQVASGATMHVTNGAFTNFAGTTLTGGTYNVAGSLEIDELGSTGGEIVTNASNIILNGANSNFVDGGGQNALSKFATNAKGAGFTITGGRNFTTAGKFTNNGTLTVGNSKSRFKVTGNLTNFSTTTDTLTGGTYNLTGTLQFKNADIVTNAANITLSGTSSQIVDQDGTNGLANFATNNGSFTINNGRNFTTAGNFTNNGTLAVGSSNSTFDVKGNLTNFSGSTLKSGTYNLTGALQFKGANIVTNEANITLNGTSAEIIDQNGKNGLANFATNNGSFSLAGGSSFTTAGNFANTGTFSVGTESTFTLGGTGAFTQSAGTTTDNGALSAPGNANIQAGSLFGTGSVTGGLQSSGIVNPGDSSTETGILTDHGAYTQNSKGALDIDIGGTAAGTQYDALNSTSASLNGTLNLSLINGFVPTIGSTFKIMNYSSETGKFSTVNGLGINNKEHFKLTYQGSDVLLTVVSGPLAGGQGGSQFFLDTHGRETLLGRLGLSGVNNAFRFPAVTSGLTARIGSLSFPGRAGAWNLSNNYQTASGANRFAGLPQLRTGRAAIVSLPQPRTIASPLVTWRPSVTSSSATVSHAVFTRSGPRFAAIRSASWPGNSFGTMRAAGGANNFSAAVAGTGLAQIRPTTSVFNFSMVGRAATKGITAEAGPLTRFANNLSTGRVNSGSSIGNRLAGHAFAISMSNIISKPKFGLGIQ